MKLFDKISTYIAKKLMSTDSNELVIPDEVYKSFPGFSESSIPKEYHCPPPTDITKTQTLESLVKEVEKRDKELVRMSLFLRNVLDVQPDVIIRFDKDMNINFVNNTFLNLFRVSEKDVMSKNIHDIIKIIDETYSQYLRVVEQRCKELNKSNRTIEFTLNIQFGSLVKCSDKSCELSTPVYSTFHTTIISLFNGSDTPIEYQCISKISCPFRSQCVSTISERV